MRSVALLGVSTAVGQAVLELLVGSAGVDRVVGLDRSPPAFHPPQLEFHPADFRQAPLQTLLRGCEAVLLVGLDALVSQSVAARAHAVRRGSGRSGEGRRIDAQALDRVVVACAEVRAARLVVLTSTACYGAHADNPVPIQEHAPLRPNADSPRALAWAALEATLGGLTDRAREVQVVRLRSAHQVGPGMLEEEAILLGLDHLVLAGSCDPLVQLVHTEDLARACVQALERARRPVYHLASPDPARLSALYSAAGAQVFRLPFALRGGLTRVMAQVVGVESLPELLPLLRHPTLVSTVATGHELGWTPRFDSMGAFLAARRQLKAMPSSG